MKTRISQIAAAAFFALFILVGNVNAKGTELDASSHENIEAALEIENWMVNDNFWKTAVTFTLEKVSEQILVLENWMTNSTVWNLDNTLTVETETEQELVMENWMTNKNIWDKMFK